LEKIPTSLRGTGEALDAVFSGGASIPRQSTRCCGGIQRELHPGLWIFREKNDSISNAPKIFSKGA
jgi:hypothetical protein